MSGKFMNSIYLREPEDTDEVDQQVKEAIAERMERS